MREMTVVLARPACAFPPARPPRCKTHAVELKALGRFAGAAASLLDGRARRLLHTSHGVPIRTVV
jgi:hypothetical protein